MKKFLMPILIILTLMAATAVRSTPLMMLAVGEMIFFILIIISSIISVFGFKINPLRSIDTTVKGEDYHASLHVKNGSKLPIKKFKVLINDTYSKNKEYIYGNSDADGGMIHYTLPTKNCGINKINISSVKVYDWVTLFPLRKKIKKSISVAVLPLSYSVFFEFNNTLFQNEISNNDNTFSNTPASYSFEVNDIKEYADGDNIRNIYWKQSARIGNLIVREYRQELDDIIIVECDMTSFVPKDKVMADSFYQLLYSSLLGLISCASCVVVKLSQKNKTDLYKLANEDDVRTFLLFLYDEYLFPVTSQLTDIAPDFRTAILSKPAGLFITCDCCLYANGQLIKAFNINKITDEIRKSHIVI